MVVMERTIMIIIMLGMIINHHDDDDDHAAYDDGVLKTVLNISQAATMERYRQRWVSFAGGGHLI